MKSRPMGAYDSLLTQQHIHWDGFIQDRGVMC